MTAIKLQLPVALPTAVGIRVFGCASPDGRITFGFTIVGLLLMITDHEYAITHLDMYKNTTLFSGMVRVQQYTTYTEYGLHKCIS